MAYRTANRRLTRRGAALAAAAFATLGAGVPLVMMVYGSIALGIDYLWWTWPAIPAVWAPSMLGAALAVRYGAPGAALLCLATAAGVGLFRNELGALTFGPAWLLSAYLYLDAGRRLGHLGRRAPDEQEPAAPGAVG